MPHYIGKQPNGKWFLFSSITDRFYGLDLEVEPEGVEGEYTWEQACVWDRYMNNPWDLAKEKLVVQGHLKAGGMMSLEEEDRLINDFYDAALKRYEKMDPEQQAEALELHKKACYNK